MKRQSKNEEDADRYRKQSEMKLKELFPRSHYRLCRLVDADDQLNALLDAFEREGMPMGSEFWPGFCVAYMRFREDRNNILTRLMLAEQAGEDPDFERAEADIKHARAMYRKRKPHPGEYECHYCGHRDAKRVTSTLTICDPCKEEVSALKPHDAGYDFLTEGLTAQDKEALGLS